MPFFPDFFLIFCLVIVHILTLVKFGRRLRLDKHLADMRSVRDMLAITGRNAKKNVIANIFKPVTGAGDY